MKPNMGMKDFEITPREEMRTHPEDANAGVHESLHAESASRKLCV